MTFVSAKSAPFFLLLCLTLSLQALETGDDLKLNPDKYVGKKVSLQGIKVTKGARAAIEAAGGSIEIVEAQPAA